MRIVALSDLHGYLPPNVPSADLVLIALGLTIYATPWTCTVPGVWAFDVEPKQLASHMERIPDGIDILMTHGLASVRRARGPGSAAAEPAAAYKLVLAAPKP